MKSIYALAAIAMLLALRIVLGFFANSTLPFFGNNVKLSAAFLPKFSRNRYDKIQVYLPVAFSHLLASGHNGNFGQFHGSDLLTGHAVFLGPRDDMPLTLVVRPCYLFRHLAGRIRCRLPHPGLRDAHACQTVLRSAGKEQAREQCKRYDTSCSPHPSRLKKIHDIEPR